MSNRNFKIQAWAMWVPVVAFFMYQFVIRVSAGVMSDDIMQRFSISATEFGALTSVYYLGYASMQMPVGLLLDRYGPKVVATLFMALILCGIALFIYAPNWHVALIGRMLIGAGSAGGLLSTAKVARLWFDDHAYANVLGITVSMGLIGAVYGSWPLRILIDQFGWENVLWILLGFGGIIALSIFTFVRVPPSEIIQDTPPKIWDEIKGIKNHLSIVKIGILGGMIGPFLYAYADVWGVSYLSNIYGLSKAEASGCISAIYMGLCIGAPFTSYVVNKFDVGRKQTALYGFIKLFLLSALLFFKNIFNYDGVLIIHFLIGLACSYQVILFVMVAKEVSVHENAFVTSIVNMINMLFGFMSILIIGSVMDLNWTGVEEKGLRLYDETAYQIAFSLLIAGLLIGSLGMLKVKTEHEK